MSLSIALKALGRAKAGEPSLAGSKVVSVHLVALSGDLSRRSREHLEQKVPLQKKCPFVATEPVRPATPLEMLFVTSR